MKGSKILRYILPDALVDDFEIVRHEKTESRFDIWLDEKEAQHREDKYNQNIIAYGFGEYHAIQKFPIRGRATWLHVRKCKWLDKESNESFSYDWELSEYDHTTAQCRVRVFFKAGD